MNNRSRDSNQMNAQISQYEDAISQKNNAIKLESHNQITPTKSVLKNEKNINQNNIASYNLSSAEQLDIFDTNQKSVKNNSKNISKGSLLEYRLKRLVFSMGYYPKIGVLLKTLQDDAADMITDLDVYGFYVHKNFSSRTIWADCKSGQAKPLERISWIMGVKQISKIDEVLFVKKGVRSSTREFARKSGIQVLDLDILEKLEKDFNIDSNDWRGSWNPETQMNQLVKFQKIDIPNGSTFKKIGNFISSGYWTLDEYTKVKKCMTALKQLSEIEQFPLNEEQKKSVHWAIFELINMFVLATLNISKELYYFSDKDKKETVIDKLISGEISMQMRKELVEATYKIAHSIILQQIPNYDKKLNVPNLEMKPPKYTEAYVDLILRITNNPLQYFDVLRYLDYIFMEFDLQIKQINYQELKSIFSNDENLVISAKTILHFICGVTGIRRELFQIMQN